VMGVNNFIVSGDLLDSEVRWLLFIGKRLFVTFRRFGLSAVCFTAVCFSG